MRAKKRIMLIDDDASNSYSHHYADILESMDLLPLEWKCAERGCPSSELLPYNAEVIIWFTADDRDNSLTPEEQAAIASFLDNGGRLLLTGQDIGFDLIEEGSISDSIFYSDYLHKIGCTARRDKASMLAGNDFFCRPMGRLQQPYSTDHPANRMGCSGG